MTRHPVLDWFPMIQALEPQSRHQFAFTIWLLSNDPVQATAVTRTKRASS